VARKLIATLTLTAILLIILRLDSYGNQAQGAMPNAGSGAIACRVVEAFEDASLGVRIVIFHQRDKADGPRLGALLSAHTGEQMELVAASGAPYRATVFRVKSAFGRGLALIPAGKLKLGEHEEFTLRLPNLSGKN